MSIGDPLSLVTSVLNDPNVQIRATDVQAIRQQEREDATAARVSALSNSDWFVRFIAARALGTTGAVSDPAIATRVLAVLGETRPNMRCIAVQLLGFLGAQAPMDLLLQALEDPDVDVRRATIEVLRWQLSEYTPLEALVNALNDPDHMVRYYAAGTLGTLGERAPRELLIQLATGSDFSLRWGAMQALGELGAQAPMDLLVDALQDESDAIRQAAFQSLGRLGDQMPIVPWIASLDQYQGHLDIWIIRGMKHLGARAPIQALIASLRDDGTFVRSDSVEALMSLAPYTPRTAAGDGR